MENEQEFAKRALESVVKESLSTPVSNQERVAQPVAWCVTGTRRLYSQYEAEQEAQHCGGSTRAYPVYAEPAIAQPEQPAIQVQGEPVALLALLKEIRPMADYGRVGTRDVDQARYQKALDAAIALLATPQPERPAEVYCACGDQIVADDNAKCGTCVAQQSNAPVTPGVNADTPGSKPLTPGVAPIIGERALLDRLNSQRNEVQVGLDNAMQAFQAYCKIKGVNRRDIGMASLIPGQWKKNLEAIDAAIAAVLAKGGAK